MRERRLRAAIVDPEARHITGYRFVRGSHDGTFVEDPEGTDRPLPGYFAPVPGRGGDGTGSTMDEELAPYLGEDIDFGGGAV